MTMEEMSLLDPAVKLKIVENMYIRRKVRPEWAYRAIKEFWPMKRIGWYDTASGTMTPYDPDEEKSRGPPLVQALSDDEINNITSEDIEKALETVSHHSLKLVNVLIVLNFTARP